MSKINLETLQLAKTFDFCGAKTPKMTVVFIHGIAADSTSLKDAFEFLAAKDDLKDIRFLAFDLLGAGNSDKSDDLDYTFEEHLAALKNSFVAAKIKTPLVLIGHSMGTFLATRLAKSYPAVKELILISPPIYSPEDIKKPEFKLALEGFKRIVAIHNPEIVNAKSFKNNLENLVACPDNYTLLAETKCKTTLIYGEKDRIIASHNLPKLLKVNPQIKAIKTSDAHAVSHEKYLELLPILKQSLSDLVKEPYETL